MTTISLRGRGRRLLSLAALASAVLALGLGAAGSARAATPGLNVASADPAVLSQALATGAKYIRLFVGWRVLEPDRADQYPATDGSGAAGFASLYDAAVKQINAAGAKPIFVVLGAPSWANGSSVDSLVPPTDPSTYASFFGRFVKQTSSVGDVAAYEVWNEEDAAEFWHGGTPGPDAYAPMLRASYAAAAPFKKSAKILVGPTTGNNASFINGLYQRGLKGSFDGVAVHTDTACLTNPPSYLIRDNGTGPINQYSFLGYQPLRDVMLANGDGDSKIWMTELGWSTASGPCERKSTGGLAGVTRDAQAANLTRAFACLQQAPYIEMGAWFTFRDTTGSPFDEIDHYGLVDTNGNAKPSMDAFKAVTAANGNTPGPCADLTAPAITVVTPGADAAFTKSLEIKASAVDGTDSGVTATGLKQINFSVDGQAPFYRQAVADGAVAQKLWLGAGALSDGKHTLIVQAFDNNGNLSSTSVPICKGATCAAAAAYKPKVVLAAGRQPSCKGLTCTIKGSLQLPAGKSNPGGRMRVEWQQSVKVIVKRRVTTKWVTVHKGGSSIAKTLSFSFTQKLRRKGAWRVRVYYDGQLPALTSTTAFKRFRA